MTEPLWLAPVPPLVGTALLETIPLFGGEAGFEPVGENSPLFTHRKR